MAIPLTQDNPARAKRDLTIANMRLEGSTYAEIAKETGVTKATVCNVLKTDHIKEIIEQGTKDLLEAVPNAVQNIVDFSKGDDKHYKYKASKDILEITGIQPSRTQNHFIQQIYIDQRQNSIDPNLLQILGGHFNDNQEVEEAEVVTIEPETEYFQGYNDNDE